MATRVVGRAAAEEERAGQEGLFMRFVLSEVCFNNLNAVWI